jgi:hypothetical protein
MKHPRIERLLRDEWLFHLGDLAGAENPDYDDTEWRELD